MSLNVDDVLVKESSSEGLKRIYDISISAGLIEVLLNDALKKKASEASFSGFRKGKVPLDVVKKMYDVNSILHQLIIDQSFSSLVSLLSKNNENIASNPVIISLDIDGYKNDKADAKCSLQIELMPDVPLIDPQSVEIDSYIVDISDNDVQKNIQNILEKSFRHTKEDSVDYKVKNGDIVYIDFVGKIENNAFKGGSANNFRVVVGENRLVSEIENALVEMSLNEEKEIDVIFDSDYHDKEVASKHAKFTLNLKSIEKKTSFNSVQDLIDHLNCKNDEELKVKIKEGMLVSVEKMIHSLMSKQFSLLADKLYVFDVPDSMVQQEKNTINEYYKQNPEQSSELDLKLELAVFRVKFGMMFAKFAKTHNIVVDKDDIGKKIMSMVYGNADYASYMVDLLKKNPSMLNNINADILESKVLDVILSKAKHIEKHITFDELLKITNGDV